MDEVLDADDAVAPELLLDQVVGGDGSTLAVDLRRERTPLIRVPCR